MAKILRVVGQTEPTAVTKKDGTQIQKCYIRLKELGNDFSDDYQATILGNGATVKYQEGEIVAASLRFQTHESNGTYFQDVMVQEIVKLK